MSKKKKAPIDWDRLMYETTPEDFPEPYRPPPKRRNLPEGGSDYLRNFLRDDTDQDPMDPEAEENMKNPRDTPPRGPKNETK